MDSSVEIFRGK